MGTRRRFESGWRPANPGVGIKTSALLHKKSCPGKMPGHGRGKHLAQQFYHMETKADSVPHRLEPGCPARSDRVCNSRRLRQNSSRSHWACGRPTFLERRRRHWRAGSTPAGSAMEESGNWYPTSLLKRRRNWLASSNLASSAIIQAATLESSCHINCRSTGPG